MRVSLRARRVAGIVAFAVAISASLLVPVGSAAPGDPGPQVTLSPSTLVFQDRPVGTRSDAQAVTLTNTGDQPLRISTFRLNGPDAADFGLGALCPIDPDRAAARSLVHDLVSFTADSPGMKSATLAIGDDAASSPKRSSSAAQETPPAEVPRRQQSRRESSPTETRSSMSGAALRPSR